MKKILNFFEKGVDKIPGRVYNDARNKKGSKKTMKKIFSILPFVLVTLAFISCVKPTYYALTTIVVELDAENDVVTCKDFNGNLWEFEGCEDWAIGDIASLLMSDRGTEKIYDDTIISARYNGYFEGWN